MGLFNSYNKTEKRLLEIYSNIFTAMGIPNPQKMAKDILNQAIKESKETGSCNLLQNSGDILLEKSKIDEGTRQTLEKRYKEGVKDEDVRWWWNLNDVERHMMMKVDEMNRMALFIKEKKEGKTSEQAAKTVRKFHPDYGDPKDTKHTEGNDKPLPIELKNRINIYVEERGKNDPEKLKREVEASSTFNALVRKEIKAGNI